MAEKLLQLVKERFTFVIIKKGSVLYGFHDSPHDSAPVLYTLDRDFAKMNQHFLMQNTTVYRYKLLHDMVLLNTSWLLYIFRNSQDLLPFCNLSLQQMLYYKVSDDRLLYQLSMSQLIDSLNKDCVYHHSEKDVQLLLQAFLRCSGYMTDSWIYPFEAARPLHVQIVEQVGLQSFPTQTFHLSTKDTEVCGLLFKPVSLDRKFPPTGVYQYHIPFCWKPTMLAHYVKFLLQSFFTQQPPPTKPPTQRSLRSSADFLDTDLELVPPAATTLWPVDPEVPEITFHWQEIITHQ